MDALQARGDSRFAMEPTTVGLYFQRSGIYIFLISFSCVYYLSNAQLLLEHYDLGWHLAAGDLIRARGSVPFQDPWAFTLGDRQWFNLSWLWDVIASAVLQFTGFSGLVLFVIACGAIIVGYLASICLSSGASALAVCIAVFFASLLYPSFVTPPNIYLAASPNTATMLFCVIFYGECLKGTRRFLLPAMMLLWANLHGGFVLGFLIIGLFGGTALLKRDWANFRVYAFVGVACLVATLLNPLGLHIYDGVAGTLGNFVQDYITEWWPYIQNVSLPGCLPGVIYISIFATLELLNWRATPVALEARLLSWIFLFLGFYQFRYMSFFFLFSTVPLALHIDRLLPRKLDDLQIRKTILVAGIVGACALPVTYVRAKPAFGLSNLLTEQDASYLKTHLSHARLLNHWNVGGLLIFRTQGTVPLFVDGRAATAYPDELLRDYFALVSEDIDEKVWDAMLAKYRIDAVLWVKGHQSLRRYLVGKRGWKEEYAGWYETVYVKP